MISEAFFSALFSSEQLREEIQDGPSGVVLHAQCAKGAHEGVHEQLVDVSEFSFYFDVCLVSNLMCSSATCIGQHSVSTVREDSIRSRQLFGVTFLDVCFMDVVTLQVSPANLCARQDCGPGFHKHDVASHVDDVIP